MSQRQSRRHGTAASLKIFRRFPQCLRKPPCRRQGLLTVKRICPIYAEPIQKLHRYVTKYAERDGKTISYIDTEPCEIVLNKNDITDYLMVIDETIWNAICYYLLGCDTQRYFLVEFYKCLEVIKTHFGNEKKLTDALKPHGFLRQVYKEAKKLANDRRRPLSIARHAPLNEPQFRALIQSGYLAILPEGKPLKLEKKRVAT